MDSGPARPVRRDWADIRGKPEEHIAGVSANEA